MAGTAKVTAVVLAAGQGKRLRSELPKVLHRAAGRPLVVHVLSAIAPLEPVRTVVVTSIRRDEIAAAAGEAGSEADFVIQDPPAGTADAVRVALEHLGPVEGIVLVVAGDTPLVTTETLALLLETHVAARAGATVLTARVTDPRGLGRIVRADDGGIAAIVEEADATEEQLTINEINSATYAFDAARLNDLIAKVDRENAQGEYYLTDVIGLLVARGERVLALVADEIEGQGVNDRAQLARASALLRARVAERWMAAGVTIVDPSTTYIDATVEIERDATIMPFTFLEGSTRVAAGAEVGPQARVVDSEIGPGAVVSYAVVRESIVGPEASVGPFASLRPGTKLGRGARLGTFVESKNTEVGDESKANHLAYLGDAEIARGVNVGAGTITTNWDGQHKHKTVIDDDAYIGSDTMLVAPVRVGKRAATGAGAVVRDDVPDDALAVGVPARIIEGKGNKMGRVGRAAGGSEEAGEEDAAPDT
ncbi:MAG: bifunctional UDP-N-acetylglucosamine diphosphorylase/glucosamine-1-phosphate N-acetyltransferase GlmU [Actinomycetota bacterium]